MWHCRAFTICITIVCITIITAAIADRAQAQGCDDRFPWTCRGFGGPPEQSYRPAPYPPRDPYQRDPYFQPDPYQQRYPYRQPDPYQQRSPYQQRDVYQPPETSPYALPVAPAAPSRPGGIARPIDPALRSQYAALYARLDGEPFPVPAVQLSDVDPEYLRKSVMFPSSEPPGTIVIDAQNHFLYLVEGGGRAMRYGVGVGRQGFGWSGVATIHDKKEWPDWYPPKEMLARQPELMRQMSQLPSGIGMPGGPRNPLGSRAMYLWQDNKDTLYRIHGTVEPWTIGQSVSSGCIRMINQDVIDLYQRTPVGAKVIVLPARS
jgi:lipoprotein-anchoring transpeptidase ErfK/SrfK